MPDAEVTDRPERWILTPAEHALIMGKNLPNRLGFAVLRLFFRGRGRFPHPALPRHADAHGRGVFG